MTSMHTMTEEQVTALRREAAEAGDREMVELADFCLDNWFYKVAPTAAARKAALACARAIGAQVESGDDE